MYQTVLQSCRADTCTYMYPHSARPLLPSFFSQPAASSASFPSGQLHLRVGPRVFCTWCSAVLVRSGEVRGTPRPRGSLAIAVGHTSLLVGESQVHQWGRWVELAKGCMVKLSVSRLVADGTPAVKADIGTCSQARYYLRHRQVRSFLSRALELEARHQRGRSDARNALQAAIDIDRAGKNSPTSDEHHSSILL